MEAELKTLVLQALDSKSYASAAFFADKLVTLNQEDPENIYLLASCYYHTQEYPRVYFVLDKYKLLDSSNKVQVLAAQALIKSGEHQKCIRLLQEPLAVDETEWAALRTYFLGKAYECIESIQLASQHYSEALKLNPFCVEAFTSLVERHLLTSQEEMDLIESLQVSPWLKQFYLSKLKTFKTPSEELTILDSNSDIQLSLANQLFQSHKVEQAYEISSKLLRDDPYHLGAVPLHCGCMAALGETGELYNLAHYLVKEYSESPASWYAAGVYYYVIKKYEYARKFFTKAYKIDKEYLPAWIAYGHTYAAQDQSDQAMSAYRVVARLFPGCHLANLYMGMEYLRTKNLRTALLSFQLAQKVNPKDPIVWNQIGVVLYKKQDYHKANQALLCALSLCQGILHSTSETIMFNLGHTYRKLSMNAEAISYYSKCIQLNPRSPSTYSALGLTYYLNYQVQEAVDCFNKALFLKSNDRFTNDLLYIALFECSETIPLDEIASQQMEYQLNFCVSLISYHKISVFIDDF